MLPNIGPLEIGMILMVLLIVFGPRRLPDLGRSLGQGIREFKQSLSRATAGGGGNPSIAAVVKA